MRHPFEAIPAGRLRLAFVPAFIFYFAIQLAMAALDAPLRTSAAPNGIVSFELAGRAPAAQVILASWNETARVAAGFGLGLDFIFMAAYSTTIGLAAVWAGRTLSGQRWPLAGLGGWLSWGLWLAVVCDSTENLMLLSQLLGGAAELPAGLAAVCATLKFLLIGAGLLYVLLGAAAWLLSRPVRRMERAGS